MSHQGFTRTAGERLGDHVLNSAGRPSAEYVLDAPIGRGGFSEVWRAHMAGGSQVAVKFLVHPEHVAQLRAEAKALAHVSGPGIVKVLAVELEHDPPFLVLALLRGGDLRARLGVRAFSAAEAFAVFERILAIMERVHREGIVHGDLKPENILFEDPPGDGGYRGLQIADFGLSRRISQRSASLSLSASLEDARIAGTLDYMAPEQRRGEKPTPRSDVFALGVIFHELLSGERPQGVFRLPSERDPGIPPVIDRAVACALSPDPELRFASASALLAFLRAGLGDDWKSLASARARVVRALAKDRFRQFWTALGASTLFGLLIAFIAAVRSDTHASANAPYVGIAGLAAGAVAAALLRSKLQPAHDRRRAALEKLRTRLQRQIRAETTWTVVREARQAEALKPADKQDIALVAGLLVVTLNGIGWLIGRDVGLLATAAASVAIGVAFFAVVRLNRHTHYKRTVTPPKFRPRERR